MDYDEYRVEFGNENEKSNDITAIKSTPENPSINSLHSKGTKKEAVKVII